MLLVGCKTDLRSPLNDPKYVSPQQGGQLAVEIGAIGYWECSAFKGVGVRAVFDDLARASLTVQHKDERRCVVC